MKPAYVLPIVWHMKIDSAGHARALMSDLCWAFKLANELRPFPPRSPIRHAHLVTALGHRLQARCDNFLFRADGRHHSEPIHPLTLMPALSAAAREDLRALLMQSLSSPARPFATDGRTLVDVVAVSPTRCAAVLARRGLTEPDFTDQDGMVLHETHAGCAWIYDAYVTPGPSVLGRLSPRERETLDHLLAGASEKEVAFALNRSRHTIHAYVKRLYRTLGVNSRGELLSIFVDAVPAHRVTDAG